MNQYLLFKQKMSFHENQFVELYLKLFYLIFQKTKKS